MKVIRLTAGSTEAPKAQKAIEQLGRSTCTPADKTSSLSFLKSLAKSK